ncbi:coatomer subunit zeta-3, partial [Trifolium pratense]
MVSEVPTFVPQVSAPKYPWDMPFNFMSERCQPIMQHVMIIPPPAMTVPPLVVHTAPFGDEQIYHAEPSECLGVEERMDDFQSQFQEMQKEIKALRGKDLFGKDVSDLCPVPNVKLPAKFKRTSSYFQIDLGEAFVRQYKYNLDMAPDRDQLRAMAQKDKETFKEYAQRWSEIAAQINPPLEEKEMTKIFLKTLGSFYYERMVVSAPSDFTEMVNMGMRLEEGVREGRLVRESGSSSGTRKFGNSFPKKKEQEVSMVAQGRPRMSDYQQQQHVATVTPVMNSTPSSGYQQQPQQQAPQQFNNQNRIQRTPQFDPIPMSYTELFPALIEKNLIQTRAPPPVPAKLPWWYRSDLFCAFHQGAPDHDLDRCLVFKSEVQRLIRANILSFKDLNPNVQANPLPNHGTSSVNMVSDCLGSYIVFNTRQIRESLVQMHINLCRLAFFQHNHSACVVCPRNPRGCQKVRDDIQGMLDRREFIITYKRNEDSDSDDAFVIIPEFNIPEPVEVAFNSQKSVVTPLVICPSGPMPYTSNKAVPYKYNATMIEDGRE